MPTPKTESPETETLDVIADRIAYKYLDRTVASAKLKSDILSALRNERERCARVADKEAARSNEQWKAAYKRNDSSPMKVYNGRRLAAEDIAAVIREGK